VDKTNEAEYQFFKKRRATEEKQESFLVLFHTMCSMMNFRTVWAARIPFYILTLYMDRHKVKSASSRSTPCWMLAAQSIVAIAVNRSRTYQLCVYRSALNDFPTTHLIPLEKEAYSQQQPYLSFEIISFWNLFRKSLDSLFPCYETLRLTKQEFKDGRTTRTIEKEMHFKRKFFFLGTVRKRRRKLAIQCAISTFSRC
jgi:hypothetical protein